MRVVSIVITTKVFHDMEKVPTALDASLEKLGLEYVDLYLIHAPCFAKGDAQKLQTSWAAMEQCAASGKAKSIGMSNMSQPDLEAIIKTTKARPVINQIEYHPYLQHGDLLAYHKSQDVKVGAYSPLVPIKMTGGPLDSVLANLAKKYTVNPGEILFRWCIDQAIVVVTTSSKEQRIKDMLRIGTFKLTPEEVEEISSIGTATVKNISNKIRANEGLTICACLIRSKRRAACKERDCVVMSVTSEFL